MLLLFHLISTEAPYLVDQLGNPPEGDDTVLSGLVRVVKISNCSKNWLNCFADTKNE